MTQAILITVGIIAIGFIIIALVAKQMGFVKLPMVLLVSALFAVTHTYLLFDASTPFYILIIAMSVSDLLFGLIIFGIIGKRHKYASYEDVPRKVLYTEDSNGICTALTEKQAIAAVNNHKDVYIHAVARIKWSHK